MRYLIALVACVILMSSVAAHSLDLNAPPDLVAKWPEAMKAINSKTDYWGEKAMKQPGGPNYEFFAELLPPLRYVDTSFIHYPIVLSSPSALVKGRFVSNGSVVNARARSLTWIGEIGNPLTFYLGEWGSVFGGDLSDLLGPKYERGYLPIVQNRYRRGSVEASQEAFAPIDYADSGMVLVRFIGTGKLMAQLAYEAGAVLPTKNGVVRDLQGGALVWFSDDWKWGVGAQRLSTVLQPDKPVYLGILTKPLAGDLPKLDASVYDAQRVKCIRTWNAVLARGMQVEVPEPIVNDAWRSLIVGTFEILKGDNVNYSVGNQYAKMYVGEGGDVVKTLALWGYRDDARCLLVPLMDYKRDDLLFHQAGKKLQLLSDYYWLTHDKGWFAEQPKRIAVQVDRLVDGREKDTLLAPKESYCGDIHTQVYSLNSNANGWSGLHHYAAALDDMGDRDAAQRLRDAANEWKPRLQEAVEKSIRKDVSPVFVPMALFGEEKPYEPLTSVNLGGYWDLVAPYVLACGFFPYDSQEARWITDYLEKNGGLMMGMVRTHPQNDFWAVNQNIDDLYTLRYVQVLLQRDEVDRALVSFYGKLAQGFTRDTFIGGEGSCPLPLDQYGRQFYLPPNSASNSFFLSMLRHMLVQDWDMDGDGTPDTLRLMFATPRRWLEDGKTIRFERAPTAFGEVSVTMTSRLKQGEVTADVSVPMDFSKKILVRARVPEGWKVVSAKAGGKTLAVDAKGTADLTGVSGKSRVTFGVRKI